MRRTVQVLRARIKLTRMQAQPFASAPPVVGLVGAFAEPFDNAVATTRTCYSPRGIITAEQVAKNPEARDRLGRSGFAACRATTPRPAHRQVSLGTLSREVRWCVLHSR